MAFKKVSQYLDEKNGMFFILPNDGDYADVIFLYQSEEDVLIADTHYLMTNRYKGYAHCCGDGCPACNYGDKGIKLQDKLFIPLLNLTKNTIEFWDRNPRFLDQVIRPSVLKNYPNPSEFVFRITRRGEAGDMNTRYEVQAVGRNASAPYAKILADRGIQLPDAYSNVCKELSIAEMSEMLNSSGSASDLGDYSYTPVPRGGGASLPPEPDINVPVPTYEAPTDVPGIAPFDSANDAAPAEITNSDGLDDVAF